MRLSLHHSTGHAGAGGGAWPVLGLVIAALVIPTACIGWFMVAAVRNERLAVRQRLVDIYTEQLGAVRGELSGELDRRFADIRKRAGSAPDQLFAQAVQAEDATSLIIWEAGGRSLFPIAAVPSPDPPTFDTSRGQELEAQGKFDEAAREWGLLASRVAGSETEARALQGQARSLARAGKPDKALEILGRLQEPGLRSARDAHGRLIAPDAAIFAIDLTNDEGKRRGMISALEERIATDADIPTAQHIFLLEHLAELTGKAPPMLAAERLAVQFGETIPSPATTVGPHSTLEVTSLPNVYAWHFSEGDREIMALYSAEFLDRMAEDAAAKIPSSRQAFIRLVAPASEASVQMPIVDIPAGIPLPAGWRLEIQPLAGGGDSLGASASRDALYLWSGGLSILAVATLGVLLGLYLTRQLRLTRLKNDLIATVSHELKTPLASMRLLVDTLQDGRITNAQQEREYLSMLARENSRLSRLIDNFLTFSRMERDKRQFASAPVNVREVVQEALAAMGERGDSVKADLPDGEKLLMVEGDKDALVTVVLNLLDNAWKYSPPPRPRRITVQAARQRSEVLLQVSDQGIGIARRHVRKIFRRFYQVDQSLSRTTGGCGLGLAIVQFILQAHHATIQVESVPGEGSTFTVRLPAMMTAAPPLPSIPQEVR